MAQAKKKTATKTAKKTTAKSGARRKTATRTTKAKGISNRERAHIYIVTIMSMIVAMLLCADVAMMVVR